MNECSVDNYELPTMTWLISCGHLAIWVRGWGGGVAVKHGHVIMIIHTFPIVNFKFWYFFLLFYFFISLTGFVQNLEIYIDISISNRCFIFLDSSTFLLVCQSINFLFCLITF